MGQTLYTKLGDYLLISGPVWTSCWLIEASAWRTTYWPDEAIAHVAIEIGGIQYTGFIGGPASDYLDSRSPQLVLIDPVAEPHIRVKGLWFGGDEVVFFHQNKDYARGDVRV